MMQLRPNAAKSISLVQDLLYNVIEKIEASKSKHSHIPTPAISLFYLLWKMSENLYQSSSVGNSLVEVQGKPVPAAPMP